MNFPRYYRSIGAFCVIAIVLLSLCTIAALHAALTSPDVEFRRTMVLTGVSSFCAIVLGLITLMLAKQNKKLRTQLMGQRIDKALRQLASLP